MAALPLEYGNLLVATGNRVLEYGPNGALAGELVVPRPTGTLRQLGGVAFDGAGRLHVHNLGGTANTVGFYDDYLSTYDPAKGAWSHVRVPSEGPNYGSDEDISILGDYAYFNTHRVNLTTGASTADAPIFGHGTAEVMAGRDGYLYSSARPPADSTRSTLRRHDPDTLETLAAFQLTNAAGDPIDIRGVAVDRAGEIYVADWMPGAVHHFDAAGNRVATLDVHGVQLYGLSLSDDGRLAVPSWFGAVELTDTSLTSYEYVFVPPSGMDYGAATVFVPEPGAALAVCACGMFALATRHRGRRAR